MIVESDMHISNQPLNVLQYLRLHCQIFGVVSKKWDATYLRSWYHPISSLERVVMIPKHGRFRD